MLLQTFHYDTKKFFLFWARILFGSWFLYVGLTKWVVFGPSQFIGFITADFDKTWSPHILNVGLAWLIIIAEPLLALWLLSGVKPRRAWTATMLLMFLLVLGQTILMKPDVIHNWLYLVFTLLCAAMCDAESCPFGLDKDKS